MSDWKDISHEVYRKYVLEFNSIGVPLIYNIDGPQKLKVIDSGSHMVVDWSGITHYIPKHYAILWTQKDPDQRKWHEC